MMSDNKLRVLVVDDEPAIRHFLKTSLAAEGYVISLAANGEQALGEAIDLQARPDYPGPGLA